MSENKEETKPQQNETSLGFNPLTHIPPSYDLFGRMITTKNNGIKYNILAEKDKIKIPFEVKNNLLTDSPMTRTQLIEKRKQERIPDKSYDLDGDGYVGGRDYVLAKRFDFDGDGKLNSAEKNAAFDAIRKGVEKEYLWNLENQGSKRAFRILQKRGKFIDAEDFIPLQDTYPRHPISFIEPKNGIKTLTDLKKYRYQQTKKDITQKMDNWEKIHPLKTFHESYAIEYFKKPKFTSVKQIKKNFHEECRKKAGLNPCETEVSYKKSPSLSYVNSPIHKTAGDIKNALRQEKNDISKILSSKKHLTEDERLKMREDEIFEKLYSKDDRKCLSKLKEERKKKDTEYNLKTFADHPIGVHGHPIPQFSDYPDKKEYWKFQDGYVENPKHISQTEYLQEIKYWKKPEELVLNDHKEYVENNTCKRLKTMPSERNEKYLPNVNKINFYKGFDPYDVKPIEYKIKSDHVYKWSSMVSKFASGKFREGRLFEALEKEDKKKELEKIPKKEITEIKDDKKKVPASKVKNDAEMAQSEPLFQKFGNKDGLKLNSSNVVRSKGF